MHSVNNNSKYNNIKAYCVGGSKCRALPLKPVLLRARSYAQGNIHITQDVVRAI